MPKVKLWHNISASHSQNLGGMVYTTLYTVPWRQIGKRNITVAEGGGPSISVSSFQSRKLLHFPMLGFRRMMGGAGL